MEYTPGLERRLRMPRTKTKPHRTYTITEEWLRDELGACPSGLKDVKAFLPCEISTDPEENLELCLALYDQVSSDNPHGLLHRASWLCWAASDGEHDLDLPRIEDARDDLGNIWSVYRWGVPNAPELHIEVLAQHLAHLADHLLTREGL